MLDLRVLCDGCTMWSGRGKAKVVQDTLEFVGGAEDFLCCAV